MARTLVRRRTPEERSRRRFTRRQWARRWLTWRYVAALLAVVLVVGGSVYAVYFSSAFELRDVEVTGAQAVSDDEVRCVADVTTGGPLATVDLDRIRDRVDDIPTIASATVTRKWPHQVLVDVEERQPVALVKRHVDASGATGCLREKEGEYRALDKDGIPFGSYKRAPDGLPLIESSNGVALTDQDALQEAVAVASALTDDIAPLVDHLDLRSIDEIYLVLSDGRLVRWGSSESSSQKAEVLVALLGRPAKVYDVSVPGQPTTSDVLPDE